MKHIKRKFLYCHKIGEEVVKALDAAPNSATQFEVQRAEEYVGYVRTEKDYLIQAFPYKSSKATCFIPEPHPVVLYFNGAQNFAKHIKVSKESFFAALDNTDVQKDLDALYTFFSNITIGTTFLYNALEAFMNLKVPNDYQYTKKKSDCTQTFDKNQIQWHLTFQEKLKQVIPDITGKYFHREYGHLYDRLDDRLEHLKECRDEIIHTKNYFAGHPTPYKRLFTIALDFDYEAALIATASYINFYEPELIEECGCGKDH
ncbi:MAG: hypothetical protein ACRYG7_34280 [Janthinobacterium lividum]